MTSPHSHGTRPPLSALQRAVIRQLAAGFTPTEVARLLRVTTQQIRGWLEDPAFAAEVEQTVASHDAAMEDLLIYGEEIAVTTALDVMKNAKDARGKIDYKTRLAAAIEFLNRSGRRGQPVQVAENKNLTLHGNVDLALGKALADPSVRAWLETQPQVVRALTNGSPVGASEASAALPPDDPPFELVLDDGSGPEATG